MLMGQRHRIKSRTDRCGRRLAVFQTKTKEFIMAGDGVYELTDDNFEAEVLQADTPVLVDFWAEWCMPCRMLAPTISELAADYEGRVKVGKLDTDANREVAAKFGIQAIPTVILFKGGEVVKKFVGVSPKKEYAAALDEAAG